MKKLLCLLLFITLGASAQVAPLADTTISGQTTNPFTPSFRYTTNQFGRLTYMYNPSTLKYDLVITSKYLRNYYIAQTGIQTINGVLTINTSGAANSLNTSNGIYSGGDITLNGQFNANDRLGGTSRFVVENYGGLLQLYSSVNPSSRVTFGTTNRLMTGGGVNYLVATDTVGMGGNISGTYLKKTDTTSLARKIGSADMLQNSYRGNYTILNSLSVQPTGLGSTGTVLTSVNNRFRYQNLSSGYYREIYSNFGGNSVIKFPYKSSTTVADSSDIAGTYAKLSDTTAFARRAGNNNFTGQNNFSGYPVTVTGTNPQLNLNFDNSNTTSLGTSSAGYFGIVASNGTYIGGTGPTSSPFNISSSIQNTAASQLQFLSSSMNNYVTAFRKPTSFTLPDNTNFSANIFGAVSLTRAAGAAYSIANVVIKGISASGGSVNPTYNASLLIETGSGSGNNVAIYVPSGRSDFDVIRNNSLTASQAVFTDANKNLVSNAITGTGSVVMSTNSTITGGTFTNVRPATTYQSSTGTTADSLSFVSSQRHVSKALVGGPGISITQTASAVTIAATPNVVEITGTSQTAAGNTIYIPHNASLTTINIPNTTTIGTLYQVVGEGSGGWRFQFAAGQAAKGVGTFTTTAGGSISSTDRYCTLTIRLVAANTFVVTTSQGTLTPN